MDSQKIYDEIELAEKYTSSATVLLGQLKQEVLNLVEENTNLRIENNYLREKLDALNVSQSGLDAVHAKTVGISNLDKLYQSGVHICHTFYGSKRHEMCLLCESLLSQHDD